MGKLIVPIVHHDCGDQEQGERERCYNGYDPSVAGGEGEVRVGGRRRLVAPAEVGGSEVVLEGGQEGRVLQGKICSAKKVYCISQMIQTIFEF